VIDSLVQAVTSAKPIVGIAKIRLKYFLERATSFPFLTNPFLVLQSVVEL